MLAKAVQPLKTLSGKSVMASESVTSVNFVQEANSDTLKAEAR